jgi:hypothetical protein
MRPRSARTPSTLLATSLIEVGVDVANATVMLIERGSVRRAVAINCATHRRRAHEPYLDRFRREESRIAQPLRVFEETSDGFRIAEADLNPRGRVANIKLGRRASASAICPAIELIRRARELAAQMAVKRYTNLLVPGGRTGKFSHEKIIPRIRIAEFGDVLGGCEKPAETTPSYRHERAGHERVAAMSGCHPRLRKQRLAGESAPQTAHGDAAGAGGITFSLRLILSAGRIAFRCETLPPSLPVEPLMRRFFEATRATWTNVRPAAAIRSPRPWITSTPRSKPVVRRKDGGHHVARQGARIIQCRRALP